MRAITVRDRDAGVGGLTVTDMPYPRAAENDVIVRVHAAGFTPQRARLAGNVVRSPRPRPDTQHPRARAVRSRGRARLRNHRLTVGQRVFGLTDWTRNGSLVQYTALEARNLAPSRPTSTTPWPPRCPFPDWPHDRDCSTTPTSRPARPSSFTAPGAAPARSPSNSRDRWAPA
jgi:NADPH:quinone reductase-like Zn-dependent oxidoreductase